MTLNGQAVTVDTAITAADIIAGKLVWTPPANGSGTALTSLTFKVQDDGGTANGGSDTSAAHTLTFDVTAVSDAPTAQDATLTVLENRSLTIELSDFGYADADNGRFANVYVTSLPAKGTLTLDGQAVTINTAISAADIAAGKLVWTPTAGDSGTALASMTFKVQDDGGTANGGSDTSAAHTLTFNVTSVNEAPTAQDATLTVLENHSLTIQLGDFGFDDADSGNFANLYITSLPASGTLTLNGQTVTINAAITAADVAAGKLVWTPAAGDSGTARASLTFKVQDDGGTANGGSDTSAAHTLTFNVTSVNEAPTAQDATLTVLENHSLTIQLGDFGFDDADSGQLANVYITSLPAKGTLTLNGQAVTVNTAITAADVAAGKLVWTPAANDNGDGLASLSFKVQDDGGTENGGSDTSTAHTLTFNVTSVNEAPTAQDATLTALEDHSLTILLGDFGFDDADNGHLANVYITSLPAKGTLTLNGQAVTVNTAIAAADIAAGKLVWTPAIGDSGTSLTSLTFKVQDDGGTANGGSDTSAAHTLTFNVTSVNEAPTAQDATLTVLEDHSLTILLGDFGFDDADNGHLANVYITSLPAKGTLTLNGQAVTVNTAITAADIAADKLVWTPAANDNGDGLASLSFKVQDDGGTENGGSDTSTAHTLTFNVTSVNDVPVLDFESASTFENRSVTMNVLADAADVDGDTLTITAASVTSGFGSVSVVGGKLVYDPTTAPNQNIDEGESRKVTVSYTVSDGHGEHASETIAVTVNGVSPDVFRGTDAAETLIGSNGDDILYGLGGNDLLDGGIGTDDMRGGRGNDIYVVLQKNDSVSEGKDAGRDLVRASVSFTLGHNIERLQLAGSAAIDGGGNRLANTLTGNKADNMLWGGLDGDKLAGGKGADIFLFRETAESTATAGGRDLILDFSHRQRDQIDLHSIDANEAKAGNQSFKFIGADQFDGHAGELRFSSSSGHTLIQADTDGDHKADFATLLHGVITLKAEDFLL